MIKINNKIDQLIERITSLYLTKGVQPSELVESVFNDSYESFDIKKKLGQLQLIIAFVDLDGESKSHIKMRYIYDENQRLLCIEQKVNSSKYVSQWDRNEIMEKYIARMDKELRALNSYAIVLKTLQSLPDDVANMVGPKLTLVA